MGWPEEEFAISFSGGRTSGMMLLELLRKNGELPSRGHVIFQNTSREHPATYEFIQRVQEFSGQEIIWLEFFQEVIGKPSFRVVDFNSAARDGSVFDNAMKFGEGGFLPNAYRRYCSRKMKRLTMERYLKSLGAKRWSNFVGIRADESRRAKPSPEKNKTRLFPLVDWGVRKDEVREFWRNMPFDLTLPSKEGGTLFGNCTGCFLKSEEHLAILCKNRPKEFAWWEEAEKRAGATFRKGTSYREIREKVELGEGVFDLEGFFCQADGGDCTGLED